MTQAPKKAKKIQRGLGRGLSTLIGDIEARSSLDEIPMEISGSDTAGEKFIEGGASLYRSTVQQIPIEWINPGPWQPRRKFDSHSLRELADSILKQGIIQPILIRNSPGEKNRYQLIAGERRWRAAQIAKIYEIPAIIRDFSEQDAAEIALIENIQRADLSSIEEAIAYQQLIKTFGYTQQELSKVIGKSRPHIANLLRLLNLPDWVQAEIDNGNITVGQIRPVIGHPDIENLAKLIIEQNLTAREVENLIKKTKKSNSASKTRDHEKTFGNKQLEDQISIELGLKTEIIWNQKTEKGSIKLSVSTLDQFDMLLQKLGIQTR